MNPQFPGSPSNVGTAFRIIAAQNQQHQPYVGPYSGPAYQTAASFNQVNPSPTMNGNQTVRPSASVQAPQVLGLASPVNQSQPQQQAGPPPPTGPSAADIAAQQQAQQQAAAQAAAQAAQDAEQQRLFQEGITQQYGASISGAQGALGALDANLPINQGLLNSYVTAQGNAARQQTQGQVDAYNQQAEGVRSQAALSLGQLADQIHGQNAGLQAQLGAVGAGSSSAVGMGQYALAHLQNQGRAGIQQQAGSNIANINSQSAAAQANLKPYLATLDAYKNQQMQGIIQNYQSMHDQLTTQIEQAKGEEKRTLALYVKNLTQAAGDALVNLQNTVSQSAQNFINQQKQVLTNSPGQFNAAPISAAPKPIESINPQPFDISPPGSQAADVSGGSLAGLLQRQQMQG